ncbi:MAG: choice-of-anchor Q domain-containing protein, partial [Gammaproteobacteria bacterium]
SYPACPGLRQEVSPVNTNYELDPLAATSAFGYLVSAFDPVARVYLPIYPADLTAEIRLVSRGAGTQESYRCAEVDQRGLERLSFVDSDCDVGAVEYQVGRRVDDRVTIQVNQASCLTVTDAETGILDLLTGNDVGDSTYVQYSLEVLSVERPGARAVVASSDPAGYLAAYAARYPTLPAPQVLNVTACPEYNPADPFWTSVQETIYFVPPANFHGETNITYRLGWETATATASGAVGGIAHVTTESRGNFASDSLDIIDIGASGPWFLLLSLLGLRGRRARPARPGALSAALVMVVLAGAASAADNVIYVNAVNNPATDDPLLLEAAAGDRRCTLREALETARNDTANLTRGDCVDGNEGPDIVELVYNPAIHGPDPSVVTLTVTLADTLVAYGSVTIRCPVEANPGLTCVIAGDGTFPLINSLGSIGIHGMTLQGGNAGNGNGGAINSYGAVSVRKSRVTDNEARIGGGIFLRGLYGDLAISESTFDNNRSRGGTNPGEGGGAVAMTAGSQHKIEIASSTFTNNTSERQAAALNIKTTTTTVIANSTFSGNSSTMGSGAIDISGVSATAVLRNITVVNNLSGFDGVQFSALEVGTGPAQHRLYNSIIAANFDAAMTQDRNCSDLTGVYLNSQFSLYGENPLAPTCPVGATDQILPAATVFDVGTPANGYLGVLQANGFDLAHTHAPNDPLLAQGIIIDAGYNLMATPTENLITPLDVSSPRCANVDQRGKSRASGGRCDIGAFEDDVVTATPDTGSNRGRRDRMAVIDILANDTAPDGQACVPNRISQPTDPYPSAPAFNLLAPLPALQPDESAVWVYYEDPVTPANPKILCALVTFDPREGEAVFLPLIPAPTAGRPDRKLVDDGDAWDDELNTASTMVLAYRDCNSRRPLVTDPCDMIVSAPYDLTDDWADALMSELAARVITYVAGDIGGRVSVPGDINVNILNVPPFVFPEVVYATPGDTVRVNVLANDIDYDAGIDPPPPNDPCSPTNPGCARFFDASRMPPLTAGGINLDSLKVTSCTEKDDIEDIDGDGDVVEKYRRCGFGDVFVDQSTGVITWIPRNAFNPFSESITYQVSDYAYPKAETRTATLTIIMDRPVTNGGAIFGDDDLSDVLGIDFLGAAGNLFFAALGLVALRRRRC